MRYPESRMSLEAALSSTNSVHSWLGRQLEVRGIDSIVYTRYIISLLQHEYSDQFDSEELWGQKVEHAKKRERKGDYKKKSSVNDEERRRLAVLDCLQSVSDQDCDIENLVDELCKRLKELKALKDCCIPLSVNTVEEKKELNTTNIICSQDPAQRYYAAFPALSGGEDSPASISPSACEVSVWKRNPLTGQLVGETSDITDTKPEDDKTANSKVRIETKKPDPAHFQTKKRSKSMTETKENDRKTQKLDSKKKVYPKGNKPKQHQSKMRRGLEKHGGKVRVLSWPLTAQISLESEEIQKEEQTDKGAEAEYCSKVEQIIKTLLLSGISDMPRKSMSNSVQVDWPEWMREESVSPELQENFEWYTQPLDEFLVTPFSKTKRLYKRHSYPPTVYFDEETDLETILGPILSSVASRYQFVDVFSPTNDNLVKEVEEEITKNNQVPVATIVPDQNHLPQPQDSPFEHNDQQSRLNPYLFTYSLDYSSPTNGQFSLFECSDDSSMNPTPREQAAPSPLNQEQIFQTSHDVCLPDEELCNTEVCSTWFVGQDLEVELDANSFTDLYDISSCSTTFDSDNGTDMSDFEGMFTFDMGSDEDCILAEPPVKGKLLNHLNNEMKDMKVCQEKTESPYDIDVPENTFFTEELLQSFNSVIESPKSTGVCSMLIDRQYLTEMMHMDLQEQMDMHSPYSTISPTLRFNIWSVEGGKTGSCWQSQVLLHEFLQTIDDDYRVTSVPWDSGLRWNLTPKNECEELKESARSGQFYQLWNVNSQKKLPWSGLVMNMPYNFGIWSLPDDSTEDNDPSEVDWGQTCEHLNWETEDEEIFLSQGTIEEDAVIGVDLLEELHKESLKEETVSSLCVNTLERNERSVSDSDIHRLWAKYGSSKPEFHRSFELIPSETSAFSDVVPCKLLHVKSAPNLKFSSILPSQEYDNPLLPIGSASDTKRDSPTEHLYFSNDTHFRPIQTPIGTPHEEKIESRRDLFGEMGFSSGTPYQQFHQPGSVEEKLPMFRPKFKVQKDFDKYIQTGRSLDDNCDSKVKYMDESTIDNLRYNLAPGQTGDIFDTVGDADDPFGKESGFESNGEIDDSVLQQKEDEDLEGCDWADGSSLEARFQHLYLDDSEQYLTSSVWREKHEEPEESRLTVYSNAWSSGYDCDDIGSVKYTSYMHYLQFLPLVKHGELSFSRNSNNPSCCDSERKSSLLDGKLEKAEGLQKQPKVNLNEFEIPAGDEDFVWKVDAIDEKVCEVPKLKGFETQLDDSGGFAWPIKDLGNNLSEKTVNMMNPFVAMDFEMKCVVEDNDFPVNSIPNSVDEMSQYYLGNKTQNLETIGNQASTHELLHAHQYPVNLVAPGILPGSPPRFLPPVPLPGTAVYSCDLEQEEIGGARSLVPSLPDVAVYSCDLEQEEIGARSLVPSLPDVAVYSCDLEQEEIGARSLVPSLPDVAVYSSDLEKQWLDSDNTTNTTPDWPPYLNIPDARKKTNTKIKIKGLNRKPCSFFLEGSCKRSDCKFSHDISTITCRFWEDGMCFKGPLCPFLHGYHVNMSDSDSNSVDSVDSKFELKKEEFPELKTNQSKCQKDIDEDKAKKTDRIRDKKKKIISTKIHKVN